MDAYKTKIIDGQIKALKEDEYNLVQLVGPGGKNINLDEGALLLLKRYYSGSDMPEAVQKLLNTDSGRIGFECLEQDTFDPTVNYEEIGRDLKRTIIKHKEHLDAVEDTLIAITGYGFERTMENIEEHGEYYDNL